MIWIAYAQDKTNKEKICPFAFGMKCLITIVSPFSPAQRAASINSAVLSGNNELLIIL